MDGVTEILEFIKEIGVHTEFFKVRIAFDA